MLSIERFIEMDMSLAALPPQLPSISSTAKKHPLFQLYMQYRQSRIKLMIDCEEFSDWLSCYQREMQSNKFAKHLKFFEFQQWMHANKGGARRCPAGDFPYNFTFWLNGGRW
jgi:hypothetical protein